MAAGIDRLSALEKAFEFIYKSETGGDYYEFGVYQGVSLARALRADLNSRKKTGRAHVGRFFGFDSFEGLPEFAEGDRLAGYEVFKLGQFDNTSAQLVRDRLAGEGLPGERVTLISGFFSATLGAPETLSQMEGSMVAIAHIDCDLYSSALECLDFLDGRLADGAVVLFDDWFCYRGRPDRGVHKAFDEWRVKRGYLVSDYFTYSWAGKAFIINIPSVAATD